MLHSMTMVDFLHYVLFLSIEWFLFVMSSLTKLQTKPTAVVINYGSVIWSAINDFHGFVTVILNYRPNISLFQILYNSAPILDCQVVCHNHAVQYGKGIDLVYFSEGWKTQNRLETYTVFPPP
jgi:hypothetical protein